ncbi:MAG: Hsp20/alpha crystallin family protein [Planctomycetes bacterium]|nr:Hsp20/alpha crystallin family protein [Planctomycetota bacterium]
MLIIRYKPIVCPKISVRHVKEDKGLFVTVELPGANKEEVELIVLTKGFGVNAECKDCKYEGCSLFNHEVDPGGLKKRFENNRLEFRVPFKKPLHSNKAG